MFHYKTKEYLKGIIISLKESGKESIWGFKDLSFIKYRHVLTRYFIA